MDFMNKQTTTTVYFNEVVFPMGLMNFMRPMETLAVVPEMQKVREF